MIGFSASAHIFDVLSSKGTRGLTKANEAQQEDNYGFDDATDQPIKPGWG